MRSLVVAALALAACGDGNVERPAAPRGGVLAGPVEEPPPDGGERGSGLELVTVDADFQQCPVREAIDRIAQESGLGRAVFPRPAGGRPEEEIPVNLEALEISAESALEIILFPRYLTFRVSGDALVVERAAPDPVGVTREIHDLRRLVHEGGVRTRPGSEPMDGGAILDLLRETLDPAAWDKGVEVTYREGGYLLVKAPSGVQRAIREVIEDLQRRSG